MNLRISQHVANTLKINNHHVTLSKLPGEVTQSLCDQALIRIFSCGICPSRIIIILVVFSLNEVLAIVVLELSTLIKNFVNE
jgi:hypothetical protein